MQRLAPQALKSITQGVLITDSSALLTYVNDAFVAITGYGPEEVIGLNCRFLQGPATDSLSVAAIKSALIQERDFSGEILNYRKNGESFWNDLTISPVKTENGTTTHFIGVMRDKTAERKAVEAREASEYRYQQLLENAPVAIVVHDLNSEVAFANSAASRILGIEKDAMQGLRADDPTWKFHHENGSIMSVKDHPACQVLSTKTLVRDLLLRTSASKPGDERWVMCNAFPVLNPEGEVREVVVAYSDVTTLKRAESDLHRSEERLRLVLKGSNDAPWDWDLVKSTFYYSPRWWQMLGMSSSHFADDPSAWRSLLHPDDAPRVNNIIEQTLQGTTESCEVEMRLRHRLGYYVPVLSRWFVLRDSFNMPVRISGTNTDLTALKRSEQRVYQLAYYDALTALPNRRYLLEQIRRALESAHRTHSIGALLFIDLDDFKVLNDTLGHATGDELLRKVASRLKDELRDSDVIGRLGGDEFLVLLENLGVSLDEAAHAASHICRELIAALSRPYFLNGHKHHSTPSVGVALFDGEPDSVELLLKQADLAMYDAKSAGGRSARFFVPRMQADLDRRVELERDLRLAITEKQLVLHFQIQVDASEAALGAEALVRWNHPRHGVISPMEFIPLAEATGLIQPLGHWVLQSACERLVLWSQEPRFEALTISVNVSAHQFLDPNYAHEVVKIVKESGANPKRLKLELTESVMASDMDSIVAKMTLLNAFGIKFSLDDFGTGYSSLSYLKLLPLQQIKIDRSFVQDLLRSDRDAVIVRVIISLARQMDLEVIAEGVETQEQRTFLFENSCLTYQGYLFGRPKLIGELEADLRGRSLCLS